MDARGGLANVSLGLSIPESLHKFRNGQFFEALREIANRSTLVNVTLE